MQEIIINEFTSSDRQVCDMDCLNCKFADCINDCKDLLEEEIERQNKLDKEVKYDEGWVEAKSIPLYVYNHSEKGRARADKYIKSEKGKAAQSRYAKSEKGKERTRKATRKRVESGKNAEYCRRYRERKKAAMAAGLS